MLATILVSLALIVAEFPLLTDAARRRETCERISGVPMCEDSPYNMTRMPNMQGHPDQAHAAAGMADFKPLVDTACSAHLKFFLCSIFTPMCTDTVDVPITSCRSVCEEVKQNCMPLLANFGLPWPDVLNCSRFPQDKGALCMQPYDGSREPNGGGGSTRGGGSAPQLHPGDRTVGSEDPKQMEVGLDHARRQCLLDFMTLEPSAQQRRTCALSCQRDVMFQRKDKDFAEVWMAIWASLCFLVTAFIVLTFWLNVARFPYPVRPVIFICVCYNLYSLGYAVRLSLGAENVSCSQDKHSCKYIIQGGLESSECVIVFLLLYYFSMSSSIWWVILTLTWFLGSARKWAAEALEKYSSFFHLAAWGIPALLSICVLILKRVDGNELTGLCFVGNNDATALTWFVIAPQCVTFVIGCAFLVIGLVAACRIKRQLTTSHLNSTGGSSGGSALIPPLTGSSSAAAAAQQSRKLDVQNMEKLVVRIGVFAVLYMVPSLCVLGCCFYERHLIELWAPATISCSPEHRPPRPMAYPRVEIFMLKLFMNLIVGVTSIMWVWSKKTWVTWASRLCCCGFFVSSGTLKHPYQPGQGIGTHRLTHRVPSLAPSLGGTNSYDATSYALPPPGHLYTPMCPASARSHVSQL